MKKLVQPRTLGRLLKRITFVAAVASGLSLGGKASAQIVQNGNFEANASSFSSYGLILSSSTSGITDWSRSSDGDGLGGAGTMDVSNSSYSAPPGYNGYSSSPTDPSVYYYQQNNYSADNVLSQDITLAPLKTYTLTFEGAAKVRLGTDVPLPVGTVTVLDDAGLLADVTVTSTTDAGSDFTLYTATFTTTSSVAGAEIELSQDQSNPQTAPGTANQYAADFIEYSDIAITEAPEPATYALLGFGVLGLWLVNRRLKNRS